MGQALGVVATFKLLKPTRALTFKLACLGHLHTVKGMNTLSLVLLTPSFHQIVGNFSWGLAIILGFVACACAFSRSSMLLGVGFGMLAFSGLMGILFNVALRYEVFILTDPGPWMWVWPINSLFHCAAMAVIVIGVLQLPKADRCS